MLAAPSHVDRVDTPGGYDTTSYTVQALARIVREEHTDPMLRRRYREVTYGLPSMDYDEEIGAVWDFVMGNVRYVRDPLGAEHITVPTEMDRQIREEGEAAEDCESIALYAATLFAAGGLKSEFEIQGRDPMRPERFTHCALRVQNPRSKEWIHFDPVGAYAFPDSFGLGDSLATPGAPLERWDLDGRRVTSTLAGLFGAQTTGTLLGDAFGDSAGDLQSVKSVADPIMGVVSTLGPYGALIGGAYGIGTGAAQIAVGTPKPKPMVSPVLGLPTPGSGVAAAAAAAAQAAAGRAGKLAPNAPGKGGASSASSVPAWVYVVGAIAAAKLLGVV